MFGRTSKRPRICRRFLDLSTNANIHISAIIPLCKQVHLCQVPHPNAQSLPYPKGQGWAFLAADQVFQTSPWQYFFLALSDRKDATNREGAKKKNKEYEISILSVFPQCFSWKSHILSFTSLFVNMSLYQTGASMLILWKSWNQEDEGSNSAWMMIYVASGKFLTIQQCVLGSASPPLLLWSAGKQLQWQPLSQSPGKVSSQNTLAILQSALGPQSSNLSSQFFVYNDSMDQVSFEWQAKSCASLSNNTTEWPD